jgi:hypothetical protein
MTTKILGARDGQGLQNGRSGATGPGSAELVADRA